MTPPDLPDAEALLKTLAAQMRPHMTPQTALIGIVTGGAWLAERLHKELGLALPVGTLDVSFYRDDFHSKGLKRKVAPSTIPFEVDGRELVLVDDVLYTGRTIRAAMNELLRAPRQHTAGHTRRPRRSRTADYRAICRRHTRGAGRRQHRS
jgi:pyrimidine operon attenuation protein / uracil phosphoribosyltransferase